MKTKPSTGIKEISGIGLAAAIGFIVEDVASCEASGFEALTCVPVDHWSALITASLVLIARLNAKRKETE